MVRNSVVNSLFRRAKLVDPAQKLRCSADNELQRKHLKRLYLCRPAAAISGRKCDFRCISTAECMPDARVPGFAWGASTGTLTPTVISRDLRELSKIGNRATLADADPNFSARIREGVPVPR
jgi:hypothetical protein